jgi:modified peptide precursor CbpA
VGNTPLGRRLRRTIREPEDLLDLIHEGEIRWKGFRQGLAPADVLYCASEKIVKNSTIPTPRENSKKPRPAVIAIRKTCDAEGTGLSHYVLMDKQVKR